MANSKVSALTQVTPAVTDIVYVVSAGASKKATIAALRAAPALTISGAAARVDLTSIVLGAACTLTGWYYLANPINNYNPIWGSDASNEMYLGDGGVTGRFAILKGNAIVFRTTNPIVRYGWHFLLIVDSGASIKAYFDNVDMGTTGIAYTTIAGMSITRLCQGSNSNNFNGHIAEAAIWSRALSAAEGTALYNAGAGVYGDIANAPFSTSLVAGWHLNEGFGVELADFSGNGHTGVYLLNGGAAACWSPGPGPIAIP